MHLFYDLHEELSSSWRSLPERTFNFVHSVSDPEHFGTHQDPRIRTPLINVSGFESYPFIKFFCLF
jgi:hypothetical protein